MRPTPSSLTLNIGTAAADRVQLRRSIRRLSDFSRTFEASLQQFNARYGVQLQVSRRQLTRSFLEWVRAFDAQRDLADRDRRDFSHFAAGLMLSSFIRNRPVDRTIKGDLPAVRQGADDALVDFWPEGVFYFEFCLTVLERVLAEQSLEGLHLSVDALELRTWQSFRENVSEDPDMAIPFLDHFLEGDPRWDVPTVASFRSALRGNLLHTERRLQRS